MIKIPKNKGDEIEEKEKEKNHLEGKEQLSHTKGNFKLAKTRRKRDLNKLS